MKICIAVLALLLTQAAPTRPTFEVATIKRNTSGSDGARFSGQAGRLAVTNNALRNIIRNAWGLQSFQIVGGPDWINNDRWDIVAKAEGNPRGPEMLAMVQNLLADRFKLVTHRETREMPIYALVLAKPNRAFGPNLHASSTDCEKAVTAAIARGGGPRWQYTLRDANAQRTSRHERGADGESRQESLVHCRAQRRR